MFYNTSFFIITHNVSSDQSPITTNRTNVTLFGVRPGETYTVEILPYPIQQASLPSLLQIKGIENVNCIHTFIALPGICSSC